MTPSILDRSPASRPRRRGFTIPELMIAVVAIAVVAGIAIPMHFGRSEVTLENAAILLARDLRAAQNNAAYMGRTMTISFDEEGAWMDGPATIVYAGTLP